jgi:uncharacterized protein (DUF924 family)
LIAHSEVVLSTRRILNYWFDDAERNPLTLEAMRGRLALWFGENRDTDEHIRGTFGAELAAAAAGELHSWAETPQGSLALIVLLDQFSRNAYRGTARAFALDAQALALTEAGLIAGFDLDFNAAQRVAFYLPIMHAENVALQRRSLALYRRVLDESPEELRPALLLVNEAAEKHAGIVERFGRYPHRNEAVGRATTPEEAAFMAQPGSSYQPSKQA